MCTNHLAILQSFQVIVKTETENHWLEFTRKYLLVLDFSALLNEWLDGKWTLPKFLVLFVT